MKSKAKLSEINQARLKAFKKGQRETTLKVKPMVTKDKRKERSRMECRRYCA